MFYISHQMYYLNQAILLSSVKYRRQAFKDEANYPSLYKHISWSSAKNLRALVQNQLQTNYEILQHLINFVPTVPTTAAGANYSQSFDWWGSTSMLLTQIYNLSDFLLDGYREELDITEDRIKMAKENEIEVMTSEYEELQSSFEQTRSRIVEPFDLIMQSQLASGKTFVLLQISISIGIPNFSNYFVHVIGEDGVQRQSIFRVAKDCLVRLAEKFKDFGSLIALCEKQGDEARLREYTQRFKLEGFAQHLFEWYFAHGTHCYFTPL